MTWKNGMVFFVGAVLVAGALILINREPAQGQGKAGSFGQYSVVSTDGVHLIVTDNAVNKIYYYAIDKDAKVGDELKLRGSLDLTKVGSPSLKPIDPKPQK